MLFALVATVIIALVGTLAYTTAAALIRADVENGFERTVTDLSEKLVEIHGQEGGEPTTGPIPFLSSDNLQVQLLGPDGRSVRLSTAWVSPLSTPAPFTSARPSNSGISPLVSPLLMPSGTR